MDLRDEKSCRMLYERVRAEEIDILINNAGFGLCGPFDETSLDRELEMIDLNIRAVHILTKLFLRDFIERDYGYILNVSSIAAYAPGPLMATYYASKAYVLRLSQSESCAGAAAMCMLRRSARDRCAPNSTRWPAWSSSPAACPRRKRRRSPSMACSAKSVRSSRAR